jgi:hypothetical protein
MNQSTVGDDGTHPRLSINIRIYAVDPRAYHKGVKTRIITREIFVVKTPSIA